MKYLSVIVFLLALGWTWSVIHGRPNIDSDTHAGIQTKLIEIIKSVVATKRPGAQNIQVYRIWTEPVDTNKVKAVFGYRFTEVDANGKKIEQDIEGDALLTRQESATNSEDKWTLDSVHATNDSIAFEEGLVVTPGGDDQPEQPEETPAAPEKAE